MSEYRMIAVELIDAGDNGTGHQDRTHFDHDELVALATDIAAVGLTSPPLVRPVGDRFELIAGERRTRAMRDILGWEEIPCLVAVMDDVAASDAMASENLVRADLRPMEEARMVKARMDRFGWTSAEMAKRLHRRLEWVANRIALLSLCDEVAHLVDVGTLGIRQGVALAVLSHAGQRAVVRKAGDAPFSVFAKVVAECANVENQASMFDASTYGLTTEQWDETAGRYLAEIAANECAGIPDDLLDPSEVAEMFHVASTTVHMWVSRNVICDPVRYFAKCPAWSRHDLIRWARDSGRSHYLDQPLQAVVE